MRGDFDGTGDAGEAGVRRASFAVAIRWRSSANNLSRSVDGIALISTDGLSGGDAGGVFRG